MKAQKLKSSMKKGEKYKETEIIESTIISTSQMRIL